MWKPEEPLTICMDENGISCDYLKTTFNQTE